MRFKEESKDGASKRSFIIFLTLWFYRYDVSYVKYRWRQLRTRLLCLQSLQFA